jgi:predicted metal-binding membrane protein
MSIFGTSVGTWAVLLVWSESPYSIYLGHSSLGDVTGLIGFIPLALIFLVSWSAMVLAMMLPATFPLVSELRRRARPHPMGRGSVVSTVAGAVALWVPFGIAAYLMDFGIHRLAEVPPLVGNVWILGFASLALAGTYQFTRTKSAFLTDCCSLNEFLKSRTPQAPPEERNFRTGLNYGKKSIGSHWAMMLLMFSLGLQIFSMMLLLATAMATEHYSKLGPRMRVPIGCAILALALYVGLTNLRI